MGPKLIRLCLRAALCLTLAMTWSSYSYADPSVRFHKINKKDQLRRLFKIGSMDGPGCHDFLRRRKVHKFGQFGFASCQLYSEKGCPSEHQLSALWGGKKYRKADIDIKERQFDLLEGAEWFLAEGNVVVKSWQCVE